MTKKEKRNKLKLFQGVRGGTPRKDKVRAIDRRLKKVALIDCDDELGLRRRSHQHDDIVA